MNEFPVSVCCSLWDQHWSTSRSCAITSATWACAGLKSSERTHSRSSNPLSTLNSMKWEITHTAPDTLLKRARTLMWYILYDLVYKSLHVELVDDTIKSCVCFFFLINVSINNYLNFNKIILVCVAGVLTTGGFSRAGKGGGSDGVLHGSAGVRVHTWLWQRWERYTPMVMC